MFALREGMISCLVSLDLKETAYTFKIQKKHQPGLNGITEDSGENCKASSTVKSLVWLLLTPIACPAP